MHWYTTNNTCTLEIEATTLGRIAREFKLVVRDEKCRGVEARNCEVNKDDPAGGGGGGGPGGGGTVRS